VCTAKPSFAGKIELRSIGSLKQTQRRPPMRQGERRYFPAVLDTPVAPHHH
jgi:hypothetical protein